MNDINYVVVLVRILETPCLIKNQTSISSTMFRVQFPQFSKSNTIIKVLVNGYVANDIVKYYRTNDYIIIEGYLSLIKTKSNLSPNNRKSLQLTAHKIFLVF